MSQMDEFETQVRSAVREIGHQADPASDLAARLIANAEAGHTAVVPFRRRPTWLLPLLAAAVVAAIAATIGVATVTITSHRDRPSTTLPATPTPTGGSPTTSPPTRPPTATVKQLDVSVGGFAVRLTVPAGWHQSRTQPQVCCNVPPTVCLVTGTADYAGNETNCVLTITAEKGLGLSPDNPRPAPATHCAKWSTPQESDPMISGRPGEYRQFRNGCTGTSSELWAVMDAPQIVFWHPITSQSTHVTVAAIVASAVLPPVSDTRRQFDAGYIRSVTHKSDGYHFTIDRVVVTLSGSVINNNPATYDYPVANLGETGGTAPCGIVNDTSGQCDLAGVLAQFNKGPHPSDGTVAVDGAFVEITTDGSSNDVLFTLPRPLS